MMRKVICSLSCIIILSLTGNISAASYLSDDFENYANNEDLAAKWELVYWGGDNHSNPPGVTMNRTLMTTGGTGGNQAMQMVLTFQAGVAPTQGLGTNWESCIYGITGHYLASNRNNLTNYMGIRLWIKPGTISGDSAYFKLNLLENESLGGEKWMSPKVILSDLDSAGQYVYLDFNDFYEYYTGSGQSMDRTSIKLSFLFLAYDETATTNSSTTIFIDDIQLLSYFATVPSPDNGAVNIGSTPTLSWVPGMETNAHDVYFGSDQDAVTNADTSDMTGVYRGRNNYAATTYNPCCPEPGTTYYWRIDEVNKSDIRHGDTWSFTVQGHVGTYSNPVIPEIGPADPAVIFYQGKYYMYPTGDNISYHVYTSYDLVNWTKGSRVFQPGGINVWAPDVFYNSADGKFYLYYTANWKIGVAVANKPDETFVNKGILIYDAIDAHLFQDDDGKRYLYFVRTNLSGGFKIFVREMANLLELTGNSKLIIEPTETWERRNANITEGPWMIKHEGLYYLLYSGSAANSQYYGVGYATANNPFGPFTKYTGNPIVKGGAGIYGPGHGAVIKDAAGELWHVYHQKRGPSVAWDRFICIDPLRFDSEGVLHGKATRGTTEPAPVVASPFDDDFENYDNDSTLALKWDRVFWSGNNEDSTSQVAIIRAVDNSAGFNESKAMKLVFTANEGVAPSIDTAAANWNPAIFGIAGTTINVMERNDLSDYTGIKFWLKRGEMIGDDAYFKMSLTEGDGERWLSPAIDLHSLNSIGEEIYVPFDNFTEYHTGSGQSMDRTNMTIFDLWLTYPDTMMTNSSATVWIDNITLEPIVESVDQDFSVLPGKFILYQNYPNPFNPTTTISYQLPQSAVVKLAVYNVVGQLVETLADEYKNAGYYTVEWNASRLSSGLYFYRIETGEYAETKKCLIIK